MRSYATRDAALPGPRRTIASRNAGGGVRMVGGISECEAAAARELATSHMSLRYDRAALQFVQNWTSPHRPAPATRSPWSPWTARVSTRCSRRVVQAEVSRPEGVDDEN